MSNKLTCYCYMLSLPVALVLAGCGTGKFPVRPAGGTVVCEGQPVTVGAITFTPVGGQDTSEPGKAATGAIGPDGSFKLSTFGRFDGAIVGKHSVEYTGSEGTDTDDEESGDEDAPAKEPTAKPKKSAFELAEELIVEVTSSGSNNFKIELVKKKKRPGKDGS